MYTYNITVSFSSIPLFNRIVSLSLYAKLTTFPSSIAMGVASYFITSALENFIPFLKDLSDLVDNYTDIVTDANGVHLKPSEVFKLSGKFFAMSTSYSAIQGVADSMIEISKGCIIKYKQKFGFN